MATVSEQIQQIYIGLLGRAADKEGLDYWTNEIESGILTIEELRSNIVNEQPEYAAGLGSQTRAQVVASLYENLFERAPESEGLEYWVNGGGSTVNVDQLVLALTNGASAADRLTLDNKIAAANYYTEQRADTYNEGEAMAAVADVDHTAASVEASAAYVDGLNNVGNGEATFTLRENTQVVGASAGQAEVTELVNYWGDPATGEGIPLVDLLEYVRSLTGLDFHELGLINIANGNDDGLNNGEEGSPGSSTEVNGGIDPNDAESINIVTGDVGDDSQVDITIQVTDSDGTIHQSEASIAVEYIDFLNDLLLDDEDGESRLFEKEIVVSEGVSGSAGQEILDPIELTTNTNNGGTEEAGFTSAVNNKIVSGRLDLLHRAYIDGGDGENTLEISAKGVYAQPKQLFNIDHVSIENLPNVYTTVDDEGRPVSTYTDLTGWGVSGTGEFENSVLDLRNAHGIETLTITEGDFEGLEVLDLEGGVAQQSAVNFGTSVSDGDEFTITINGVDISYEASDNGADPDDTIEDVIAELVARINNDPTVGDMVTATAGQNNISLVGDVAGAEFILDVDGDISDVLVVEAEEPTTVSSSVELGDLTISGVRNDATTIVEGSFTRDVKVHYSDSLGDGINVVLNNVNFTSGSDLDIAHNSPTLNIDSIGGGNTLKGQLSDGGEAGLQNLNITGDAFLYIQNSIASDFAGGTPAHIDASANTAGVDLNMDSFNDEINFTGTLDADDHFSAVNTSAGRNVNVYGGDGDNEFSVETDGNVVVSAGEGNNEIWAISNGGDSHVLEENVTVTVLGGNNHIGVETTDKFDISAGDGNNLIDASSSNDTAAADAFAVALGVYQAAVAVTAAAQQALDANPTNTVLQDALDDAQALEAAALGDLYTEAADLAADSDDLTEIADDNSIVVGDGDNQIDASGGRLGIVAGDGSNQIQVEAGALAILAGDGGNDIDVDSVVFTSITTGAGDDSIEVSGMALVDSTAIISAGEGDNTVTVDGVEDVIVSTGSGNDSVTIVGGNLNFDSSDGIAGELSGENGDETSINVNVGGGTNTVTLGSDDATNNAAITATDGSVIAGENITLVIQSDADLSRADVSGVTAVQMGNGDSLTLTLTQFIAMGGSTSFNVIGESFNAKSHINIIVDQSTSLDGLNIDALPRSIDLSFEIQDGVQLELTAQQLHERVIEGGVSLFNDMNTDFASGTVLITEAGQDFDPFNNNDAVRTTDANATYVGGSLGDDFGVDLDTPANGVQRDEWGANVLIDRTFNGYDRPDDQVTGSRLTINTDTDLVGGVLNPIDTIETFLRIVGDAGLTFVPVAPGVDEWGRPIEGGDSIELASDTESYLVDFSSVGGSVENLTLGSFENAAGIYGNGDTAYARVNVHINEEDGLATGVGEVGSDAQGLISSGVQAFVVTDINDHASGDKAIDFYTCETTHGLEVLGMQGLYENDVNFLNTERGVEFLMEVVYSKSAGYVVGELTAHFARDEGDAVVNVVGLEALPAGEVQMVAGINTRNAETLTVNVTGGDTIIAAIDVTPAATDEGDATELTLTADADLSVTAALDGVLESVDASGVAGDLTLTVAPTGDFDFVGAAGSTSLIINSLSAAADVSFASAGTLTLLIDGEDTATTAAVNLTGADVSGVDAIVIGANDSVTMTIAQTDTIGHGNITGTGTLNLVGLGEEEFSLAGYNASLTVNGVNLTVVDADADGVVTLHPDTDLTGVTGLVVPKGVTLNLTAAQFQQLNGAGAIVGEDITVGMADIATVDFTVNVTDLMQDDIGSGLDLTGITAASISLTLGESVEISDTTSNLELGAGGSAGGNVALSENTINQSVTINIGDDMTFTHNDASDLDDVAIVGGTNSTVVITELTSTGNLDASGWDIDVLRVFTNYVNGQNIDNLFQGLSVRVLKDIVPGLGDVMAVDQTVTIDAGSTITGGFTVNRIEDNYELANLTVDLEGGVEIVGGLLIPSTDKNDGTNDLLHNHLQSLTINSTGTAVNPLSGDTANIINGNIDPTTGAAATENGLLNLIINAEQNFEVQGNIILSSVTGDDDFTFNDDDAATATITVNGTADVDLGTVDSNDDDVDAVVVNNAGTGTVSLIVNAANIDSTDALSFTGSNIELSVIGTVNLSDDDLSGVSSITVADGGHLTLSFAQLNTLTTANVNGTAGTVTEDLTINAYDGSAFDFTTIDEEIDDVNLVLDGSDVALDASVNLTGVDSINANGGSITLTAEQFQQLEGTGTITNAVNVTITGLTQAVIDAGSFDLSGITASGSVTVEVAEDLNLSDDDNIENATQVNIGSFHLVLVEHEQADDLVVTGDAASVVTLQFDIDNATNGEIEAGGYDVGTLRAIATTVSGLDAEVAFDNLANSVTLSLFEDPNDIGLVSAIHRSVIVEDGVSVSAAGLIFNGQDSTREMRTLTITFEGDANDGRTEQQDQDGNLEGSVIDGDLILYRTEEATGLTPVMFQKLTLNSEGAGDSNAIDGDIMAVASLFDVEQTLDTAIVDTDVVSITVNTNVYSVTADIPATHADAQAVLTALAALIEAGEPDLQVTVVDDGLSINGAGGFTINTDLSNGGGTTTEVESGRENNLLDVEINADSDFAVTGAIYLTSTDVDQNTGQVVVNGTGDVTIGQLNASDTEVTNVAVTNNSTGTLTIEGGSPAIVGAIEALTFTGTGDVVLGTVGEGIVDNTISAIDASGLSGDLTMDDVNDVDNAAFTFTSGTGVTSMTFSEAGAILAFDADTAPGIVIDYTNAADGSELHLGAAINGAAASSVFTVLADADTTIYIDVTMDLSGFNASLPAGATIVVADGVTLTLTAAQASGLTIIGENGVDSTGVVNINNLGDDAVDLSLISADVAGTATLEDDDVTLDATTNLGEFSVTLTDVADGTYARADELQGQTIRFQTVEQAERDVIVGAAAGAESTNVIWLFESVTGPVDTSGYSAGLDRLWFSEELANGADIEDLFSSLPNTILRVDFADLTDLEDLLTSLPVDRTIELASFTTLGDGLEFNDSDVIEHVRTLTINMGGQVTVGDIEIDNIIDNTATYTAAPTFDTLTINSVLADDTGDLLARENFDEEVNAKPVSGNTVGNISAGTDDNVDLLNVILNTGVDETTNDTTTDSGTNVLTGTSLTVGDITFDAEPTVPATSITATLTLSGANDITIASVDASDTDIDTFNLEVGGFTGVLDPVMHLDDTETFSITDTESAGTATLNFEEVEGNELSDVDFSGSDDHINITFSQIDSNDDDTDGDTVADQSAFIYDASSGINTVVVMAVGANVPTLEDGSTWEFDFTGAAPGSSLTIGAGTVLEANSTLDITLGAATLLIDDTVDLTGVTVNVTGGNLEVTAGSSLTISVAQLAALDAAGVDIVGAGTLVVTGDGTDAVATIFESARTANVDLSAVTIDGTDADTQLAVTLDSTGSVSSNTDQATLTFTADDVDDGDENITVTYTVNGANATGSPLAVNLAMVDVTDADAIAAAVAAAIAGAHGGDLADVTSDGNVVTLHALRGTGDDVEASVATGAGTFGDFDSESSDASAPVIAGISLTGSDEDDVVTGSDEDDTFTLGAGDDDITGGTGSDTFNVDEGTDTINDLEGDGEGMGDDDVLVVSTGATANATTDGFEATVDTSNEGTASITLDGIAVSGSGTIDMSNASGPNGYTITGDDENDVASTLIGSAFGDIINGGDNGQDASDDVDVLTGNDGNDQFVFDVTVSSAAVLTSVTTTTGIDREVLDLDAAGAEVDGDNESVSVTYTINGITDDIVLDLSAIDVTNQNAIATAIADALDAKANISATVDGADDVVISGDNAGSLTITDLTWTNITTQTDDDFVDGTDQAQVTTLTVSGTPTAGDFYSLTASLVEGGGESAEATADADPTTDEIATDIEATFTDADVTADVVGSVVTFTDADADDGGFSITTDTTAAFGGSGASETGAADYTTADIITDFVSGEDSISFGLAAGNTGTNYFEAAAAADYATALANADAAFDGTVQYYMTSATDLDGVATTGLIEGQEGAGILFVDANLDGSTDLAVLLVGVDQTNFHALDIVA